MPIHLWGTDFNRTSAAFRGKLYLDEEKRHGAIQELISLGFNDLFYLSTCNRVEFYTTAKDTFSDTRSLWEKLINYFDLPPEAFYKGYHLEGKSTLRHLLRVASSLESMVVGETQILGQIKEAHKWTKENKLPLSGRLDRSLQLAYQTAKQIRTETSIGEKSLSVATLGLQKLRKLESEHPLKRAVVVGRSPMSLFILRWLRKNRPGCEVFWVNRTVDVLLSFPESEHTETLCLSDFLEQPPSFTHLFTATSSTEPIFQKKFLDQLREAGLFVDLAQPPDVDATTTNPNLKIVQLEDLEQESKENANARSLAIEQAELLIAAALRDYYLDLKGTDLMKNFNQVEPKFMKELQNALENAEPLLPADLVPKLREWAKKLVRRNLHNSREHLRLVLKQNV